MINPKRLEPLVSQLDTAAGMLLVAAVKDPLVKAAMEKVSRVSWEIGEVLYENECEEE